MEKSSTDEEDVVEIREDTLTYMATSLASSVEVGNIGALGFEKDDQKKNDETVEDYYLVEFIGKPYLEQRTGAWLVDCCWLLSVPRARHWYTKSKQPKTVNMMHIVATDVRMNPSSPTNMIPKSVRKRAEQQNAIKISLESHDFIMDEISRRERLEYDPSRVVVDNESNSDIDE